MALRTCNISETNKIKDIMVHIRYISINFDKKFEREKQAQLTIHWFFQTLRTGNVKSTLKELRNRISRIIRLWSLFCSIRVYASLHFLQILLENQFFIILLFLSFLPVCVEFDVIFINFITYNIQVHVICVFVLT